MLFRSAYLLELALHPFSAHRQSVSEVLCDKDGSGIDAHFTANEVEARIDVAFCFRLVLRHQDGPDLLVDDVIRRQLRKFLCAAAV